MNNELHILSLLLCPLYLWECEELALNITMTYGQPQRSMEKKNLQFCWGKHQNPKHYCLRTNHLISEWAQPSTWYSHLKQNLMVLYNRHICNKSWEKIITWLLCRNGPEKKVNCQCSAEKWWHLLICIIIFR